MTVESVESAEVQYYGDEHLLRQMLLNLLDNAIRHTPSGGRVRVSLAQFDSTCKVIVADTGEGIPVEAQPHIFERFYRVDRSRSRKMSSGSGLGLSIAYQLTVLQSGDLSVQSEVGKGTTFTIWLKSA